MNQNIIERMHSLLDLPHELHRHQETLRHQEVEYENLFRDLTKNNNIHVNDVLRLQERYFDSITLTRKQIDILQNAIRELEDTIIADIKEWARGYPIILTDELGYTFIFSLVNEKLSINKIAA